MAANDFRENMAKGKCHYGVKIARLDRRFLHPQDTLLSKVNLFRSFVEQ